jgi:hypothetical protein
MLIPVYSWTCESRRPWRDIERAISLSSSEMWRPTMVGKKRRAMKGYCGGDKKRQNTARFDKYLNNPTPNGCMSPQHPWITIDNYNLCGIQISR